MAERAGSSPPGEDIINADPRPWQAGRGAWRDWKALHAEIANEQTITVSDIRRQELSGIIIILSWFRQQLYSRIGYHNRDRKDVHSPLTCNVTNHRSEWFFRLVDSCFEKRRARESMRSVLSTYFSKALVFVNLNLRKKASKPIVFVDGWSTFSFSIFSRLQSFTFGGVLFWNLSLHHSKQNCATGSFERSYSINEQPVRCFAEKKFPSLWDHFQTRPEIRGQQATQPQQDPFQEANDPFSISYKYATIIQSVLVNNTSIFFFGR